MLEQYPLDTFTRIYQGDIQQCRITPGFVQRPSQDYAPLADGWALDLLSTEGFLKMQEIVDYVVTNSAV